MSGKKDIDPSAIGTKRSMRPAITIDERENQMIKLAVDLAEKQLLEGTASSQVITHYLKLGTTREKLERELLKTQKELLDAKKEALRAEKQMGEMYQKALAAMKKYQGGDTEDESNEDQDLLGDDDIQ